MSTLARGVAKLLTTSVGWLLELLRRHKACQTSFKSTNASVKQSCSHCLPPTPSCSTVLRKLTAWSFTLFPPPPLPPPPPIVLLFSPFPPLSSPSPCITAPSLAFRFPATDCTFSRRRCSGFKSGMALSINLHVSEARVCVCVRVCADMRACMCECAYAYAYVHVCVCA